MGLQVAKPDTEVVLRYRLSKRNGARKAKRRALGCCGVLWVLPRVG